MSSEDAAIAAAERFARAAKGLPADLQGPFVRACAAALVAAAVAALGLSIDRLANAVDLPEWRSEREGR